jgi:ankyrin repeat protein
VNFLTKSPAVATLLNKSDDAGSTPLWLACRTGNLKMVELLIEAGADETIADNEGLAPKDVASKYKKVKVDEYFQNRSTR